ncbi:MAG TPA: ferredoxin-type protein NapF [Sulfurimonas sp.]|nr:ferredoxin-type protein NapF [Sulfurimonas sp.]
MQRRELFTSLVSGFKKTPEPELPLVIRPPYNKDSSLFEQECKNCDAKCASVCEENIIFISEDKTPYLSFEDGGCTFCDECASVCEFGVLTVENKQDVQAQVRIDESLCMSFHSVMCFSCKDPCLENAIVFEGLFKPVIDMSKCTACGFCISRCPSSAIVVESKNETT